jgi:hypothetical protein
VSRRAAAVSPQMLCYDDPMADVVSPGTAKKQDRPRKPRTEKHIVVPATAAQISRAVGVTKKDAALVKRVLLQLGYIKEEKPAKKASSTARRKTPVSQKS